MAGPEAYALWHGRHAPDWTRRAATDEAAVVRPVLLRCLLRDGKWEVLDEYPDVATAVFNAFAESKYLYLERLRGGSIENLTAADQLHLRMMEMMDDPLPYGISPNRAVLENLIANAASQEILRKPTEIESVFESSTLELTG